MQIDDYGNAVDDDIPVGLTMSQICDVEQMNEEE